MARIHDPYRDLGVARGASDAQIKAAHRRLAKRFHPDAASGDMARFLAVQEAWLLLSDPLRRREWDARHAPGPVRAGEPVTRPRPRTSEGDGQASRQDGAAPGAQTASGTRRGRASGRPPRGRGTAAAGAESASGASAADGVDDGRRADDGFPGSASGRDPATRSYTWSAEGVPWWEDFRPRSGGGAADGDPAPAETGQGARGAGQGEAARGGQGRDEAAPARKRGPSEAAGTDPARGIRHGRRPDRSPGTVPASADFDVYSRSSGAAWSMAARRYFRRGDADLPKGGSFRYRGTQVVTGAEARRVAAEDEHLRQSTATRPAPRRSPPPEPAAAQPRPARSEPPAAQRPPSQPEPVPPAFAQASTPPSPPPGGLGRLLRRFVSKG